MNQSIFFISVIVMIMVSQFTFADENRIELKKGCIKDYPLVADETDPDLLNIYSQICDKKNKKNIELKNELFIQAAQKFQQLGKNLKALQLVDSLRKQNIQHTALTDVTFLAGVGIAQSSLQHMRNNELRYLSPEMTYPAAKQFSESIRTSLGILDASASKVEMQSMTKNKKSIKETSKKLSLSHYSSNKKTQLSRAKSINPPPVKTSVKTATAAIKPQNTTSTASGSSPFSSFKNN
ncbi:hypothetical protein F994_02471 [Acinetobacter bohemicus ANC 3994]|uniref:Uncharacterized protein n=2 Tax=Acinetobacter bohemicus TaxID=1435036 RepID=N8NZ18_9GAMM|nr:hypothetical protein F994_02471 [Acinetobacter bohemicus ANC 3994]